MKNTFSIILVAASALLLSACQNTAVGPATVQAMNRIMSDLQRGVSEVQTAQDQLQQAQAKMDSAHQTNAQFAADHVNEARLANSQNNPPNSFTNQVSAQLNLAAQVLPQPSTNSDADIQALLQLAATGTPAAIAQLKNLYAQNQQQADQLKTQITQLNQELAQVQSATRSANENLTSQTTELARTKAAAQLAASQQRDTEAARNRALAANTRMKVATVFMVAGGIIIIGGVVAGFLHVGGVALPCACMGIALLIIGWLITYIENLLGYLWFKVGVGVLLATLLGLAAWFIIRALATRRQALFDSLISTNTLGAIQEAKNDDAKTGTATFAALKPYLLDWHTTPTGYPDTALMQEIDARLAQMNLLNPKTSTSTAAATTPTSPPPSLTSTTSSSVKSESVPLPH